MDDLTLLTPDEIYAALADLNAGWELHTNVLLENQASTNPKLGLSKTYTFGSFSEATDFVATIGDLSDDMEGHHPISVEVRGPSAFVTLHTTSVGGITDADLDMAQALDGIVQGVLAESVSDQWLQG